MVRYQEVVFKVDLSKIQEKRNTDISWVVEVEE